MLVQGIIFVALLLFALVWWWRRAPVVYDLGGGCFVTKRGLANAKAFVVSDGRRDAYTMIANDVIPVEGRVALQKIARVQ